MRDDSVSPTSAFQFCGWVQKMVDTGTVLHVRINEIAHKKTFLTEKSVDVLGSITSLKGNSSS